MHLHCCVVCIIKKKKYDPEKAENWSVSCLLQSNDPLTPEQLIKWAIEDEDFDEDDIIGSWIHRLSPKFMNNYLKVISGCN